MYRVPGCSPTVTGFDPSRHPQTWRPSLVKITMGCPEPATDVQKCAVQTSAEEEEDCPGGTERTAMTAGGNMRLNRS